MTVPTYLAPLGSHHVEMKTFIGVEVKGNSLPGANTLGSATIDVVFDNTMLAFVNASLWAFEAADGYTRGATNNTTSIQSGYLSADMNLSGDVTILDRTLWRANNSVSSQVP